MAGKITLNKSGQISLKEGYIRFIQQKRAMNVAADTIKYYDTFNYIVSRQRVKRWRLFAPTPTVFTRDKDV